MTTTVFITGVGRGIGRGLLEAYLARPNHTVIGSVRNSADPKYDELKALPAGEGSKLILVSIESSSLTDPKKAVEEVQAAGVSVIDIVIANAGYAPPTVPAEQVEIKDVVEAFNVNTVGPIVLYQAVRPLLEKSAQPKWLSVSTAAASIDRLDAYNASFVAAYGISKAAQNWFTVGVHSANKSFIVFAIHPGLVQTEMGNAGARSLGLKEAPNTIEESVTKTIDFVEKSTREETSGKFFNVIDGAVIPW
ncbi:NAD(P)-binding protein [Sodiomyces alkalinus F11]|uniref:NAD(P)-binding protein n=1 Tax=Sodiomyces alkalinus (strain CBS 110278 / VKM F-3762 / F11) TaxID=1314773 RepID=A0A3N2PUI3_SODAK|nr:NAD(P)-binding protein [Sodiomyces alkalinus F11]ROT38152.1 NAD(P)-binding protein [Sodiomyces alkalinus F11]